MPLAKLPPRLCIPHDLGHETAVERTPPMQNAEKLPAYTGVELPDAGYVLFKLTQVHAGDKIDDPDQGQHDRNR